MLSKIAVPASASLVILIPTLTIAQIGKWAPATVQMRDPKSPYRHVSMRVDKVSTIKSWKDLGPFVRFGVDEAKQTAEVKKAIDSHRYKAVVVTLTLRNDSSQEMHLGYYVDFNSGSESVQDAYRFFLRSEDGAEVCSGDTLGLAGAGECALHMTYFLKGGFPKDAAVRPKGTITGRICYVVKDWFKPSVIFPRRYDQGSPDHGVKLK